MYFATVEDISRSFDMLGQKGEGLEGVKFTPDIGEYFSAQVARAFDRTTGVRAYENWNIRHEELKAKEEGGLTIFENEEEYKASEHYRKNIAFEPGMSDVRARIYAENYDKRRDRDHILQSGSENGPWWYGPIGFGGGIIGSLPDPVNFIPFAGGAIKGVTLAGMTVRQVAGASLRRGLIEGAAANLVASSVAAADLNRKGENITTQEVLLDTMFGAVAGPLFHGGGSFISRGVARRGMRADIGAVHAVLPEGGDVQAGLGKTFDRMKRGEAAAYADAGRALEILGKEDFILHLRESVTPSERLEIARAMELALHDFADGRSVDVSPVLRDSPTISKLQIEAFINSLESGQFTDVNFGKLRPEYKAALNEIRTLEGVPLIQGDDLIIPAKVVEKLHEKRMLQEGLSADGVAEILLNVFHREADFVSAGTYPHIQAIVALRKELADIGFIGINPKSGETVIKSGFITDTKKLHQKLKRAGKSGSEKYPGEAQNLPSVDGEASPPLAAPRLSALQGESNILHVGDNVNTIDWRVAQPQEHSPLLPLSKEAGNLLHETGIDPKTGISPEEAHLARLDAEGRLSQSDREAMLLHNEETARINNLEEKAISVIDCVLKAVE